MTLRQLSRSIIEADRLQVTMINDDPDGLPSYDRAFLVHMKPSADPDNPRDQYQRVTLAEAREIARFLTCNVRRAKRTRLYGNIRRFVGLGSRPRDVS